MGTSHARKGVSTGLLIKVIEYMSTLENLRHASGIDDVARILGFQKKN